MFKLTTKGSEGLKTIIGLSNSLNDEAVINVTKDGLDFKVMDQDRSGLLDCTWKSETMVDFECDGEHKIGIRTADILKVLKRAGKDDNIKLSHDGNGVLEIRVGENKVFSNRLVETDMISTGSTPKVKYENSFPITHSALKEKVDDMLTISADFMEIRVNNGEIGFKVEDDGQKCETLYKNESVVTNEEVTGKFSVSHLDNALKQIKIESIDISILNNLPLCMAMTIVDMGVIKYYLAPVQGGN
jgi:DNA polymerase III sliding clamp (beta) subunit (PCNA family)